MERPPVQIRFRQITKRFGPIVANDRVSLDIPKNSLFGIVGENGAGKSTIMKILYGMYAADSGEILLDGKPVSIRNPTQAIQYGIGMVHQHFMLVPTLSVWQNIVLGSEPHFILKKKALLSHLDQLQQDYGFNLDLQTKIEELPVGKQQQVEILKLLYRKAQILILDEPTAVLTPQEVERLFERLKKLWADGKTIILITHKLKEILALTQYVAIMRAGRIYDCVATNNCDETRLCELIIGRKLKGLPDRKKQDSKNIVLKLDHVSVQAKRKRPLKNFTLEVHEGEIVGIAGVEGNGQQTLFEVLSGVQRSYSGSVLYRSTELKTKSIYSLKQSGIAYIPPDRHRQGVILDFTLSENFRLGHHHESTTNLSATDRSGTNGRRPLQSDLALCETFDVRPPKPDLPFSNFSGGNQQKAVIAREIRSHTRLVIAAHPTRGVDIGAIEYIHRLFLELREKGAAILLISSELDEILALSDRIAVLYEGGLSGEVLRNQATEHQLGRWMTGGRQSS